MGRIVGVLVIIIGGRRGEVVGVGEGEWGRGRVEIEIMVKLVVGGLGVGGWGKWEGKVVVEDGIGEVGEEEDGVGKLYMGGWM